MEPSGTKHTRLYKYFTFDAKGHWKLPLQEQKIFFSAFPNLNDPFECTFEVNTKGELEKRRTEILKWNSGREYQQLVNACKTNEDLDKFVEDLNTDYAAFNIRRQLASNVGIACFSKSPRNPLMWSHYTRGHGGFCLEIDASALWENFRWIDVKYVDKPPSLSIFDAQKVEWFFGHKNSPWSYEEEVRALGTPGKHVLPANCVRAIYLGINVFNPSVENLHNLISLQDLLSDTAAHLRNNLYKANRSPAFGIDSKSLTCDSLAMTIRFMKVQLEQSGSKEDDGSR
jgi:hypothetical protein